MILKNTITFLIPFSICSTILILNILQGSQLEFVFNELHDATSVFGVLLFLSTYLFKFEIIKKIRRILIAVILSSVLVGQVEPKIFDYQLEQTNKNLENLCNAIELYLNEHKKFPETLMELDNYEQYKSGFYLIGGEFEYSKTSESKFYIYYFVKDGVDCEAWNCSTFFANMKYTSVICGSVNKGLNSYEYINEEAQSVNSFERPKN